MKLWKVTFALAVSVIPMMAGALTLETADPASNPEAMAIGAVLTARITACHSPQKTTVQASAEGMVQGVRRSVPVTVIALHTPGTFAVKRQWPETGIWAIRLSAWNPDYSNYKTGVVVPMEGNTFKWPAAQHLYREPLASDADAFLLHSVAAR